MASNGTSDANGVEGNGATGQTAPRACSALRKACDREVSTLVEEILRARHEGGDLGCSDAKLAERLDFGSKTTAQQLRTGGSPWHLGDLYALPKSLATEILHAMLARIERGGMVAPSLDLRDHALDVSAAEGELARVIRTAQADGEIDDAEGRAIAIQSLRVADKALDTFRASSPAARRGGK